METSKIINYRFIAISLALVCFPTVTVAAIHVELAVDSGTTPASLYVTENDSQCTNGAIDCVEVVKGSSPNLYFDLDEACKQNGPQYRLEQIRIAMAEKDWPTRENPLPQHVADDFYADPDTGVIDAEGGNGGWNKLDADRIKIKDRNSNAYTVFYEITARQCDGDETILLDPSVNNRGK